MSGPKVVRVVTREELAAQGAARLRRLDATIADWTEVCERSADRETAAAAIQAMAQKRSDLQRMLTEDRFADLRTQTNLEEAFLERDIERLIMQATRAARLRRRRAADARKLLKDLEASGRSIPEDLRRALHSPDPPEQAVAQALTLLSPAPPTDGTEEQPRQQSETGGAPTLSLSAWRAQNPQRAATPAELDIERLLAELTALGADATPWSVRAAALVAETPERQALLAGSLSEDLSQAVKAARARIAQVAALGQAAAELSGDSSQAAQALRIRIDAALASADAPDAQALVAEAAALAADRQRSLAADARRRVMLEGLSRLGYELNEGMATAWVQDGKVVLRNANHPGYAVELANDSKSDRVHVRVVAGGEAGAPRDATRDIDVETLWCAELERLRSSVASTGGSIEIEQALPAGAAAVELIEGGTEHEVAEATGPRTWVLER